MKTKAVLYFSESRENFYRITGELVEVLINDFWIKTALKPLDTVHLNLVDLGEF